jgi:hypothetical protein
MGSLPPSGFEELLLKSTGKKSNIVPGCVLAAVDRNGTLTLALPNYISR